MNHLLRRARTGLAMAFVVIIVGAARAEEPAPPARMPCFSISQWRGGWRAPADDVIYIGINARDIYRVDLSVGSPQLRWPGNHLVTVVRGSDSVCAPIDLDLSVANEMGFREHLFAKAITKLTADQVAALAPADRP